MFCSLCNYRINQSAKRIECATCKNFCHKLCIPGIHRYDEFYKRIAVANDWICPKCNGSIFPFNHIDDDDDFLICLSEQWHVSYSTDIKKLRDKVFNPFEINNDKRHPLFNYDPDFHYYNLVCNSLSACDYYLEDAFNEKCEELTFSSMCFSLLHCNIRSIPRNLHALELYVSNLSIKFSVMGFSETWLTSANCSLYSIDGYNVESAYRSSRRGGGVSLYVREHIVYTCRTDLDIFDEYIESKFIEIDKKCINE